MSEVYEIADAVTAGLNAGTWNTPILASRVYVPQEELKDLLASGATGYAAGTVLVTPIANEIEIQSRDQNFEDIQIAVGYLQKLMPTTDPVASKTNADIDQYVKTMRQIALLFGPQNWPAADAAWWKTKWSPIYDAQRLKERLFLSVVIFTFRQSG